MQVATTELQDLFKRMEGLTVEVDPEICVVVANVSRSVAL